MMNRMMKDLHLNDIKTHKYEPISQYDDSFSDSLSKIPKSSLNSNSTGHTDSSSSDELSNLNSTCNETSTSLNSSSSYSNTQVEHQLKSESLCTEYESESDDLISCTSEVALGCTKNTFVDMDDFRPNRHFYGDGKFLPETKEVPQFCNSKTVENNEEDVSKYLPPTHDKYDIVDVIPLKAKSAFTPKFQPINNNSKLPFLHTPEFQRELEKRQKLTVNEDEQVNFSKPIPKLVFEEASTTDLKNDETKQDDTTPIKKSSIEYCDVKSKIQKFEGLKEYLPKAKTLVHSKTSFLKQTTISRLDSGDNCNLQVCVKDLKNMFEA